MLYILYGPDDFSLQERLRALKREWDDEESLAINSTIFDGRQLKLNQAISACNTVPFIGQKRLVIVEGLLDRFESRGTARQSKDWEEWQALKDYIDRMPPTTILILIDGRLAKDNMLLRILKPKAIVQNFPLLKGGDLQRWIISRAAGQGGTISPQAVRLLAELGGGNLWLLANEIDKLLLYTAGRRIEKSDVEQLTSYAREANVFTAVDAIIERRPTTAVHLLHVLPFPSVLHRNSVNRPQPYIHHSLRKGTFLASRNLSVGGSFAYQ